MSTAIEEWVSERRREFPMLRKTVHGKPLIYFDSGATSLKPQCVIDAVSDFYQREYGTVHRAVYSMAAHSTEKYSQVREKVRALIGAEATEEVIFTSGATEGINLVASSFGRAFVGPGDEILVSEVEHHANIVPWQMMCTERGAVLRVIPVNDEGELDLEAFQALLSDRTRLVAVAHVVNSIGTVNPVKEICELAHSYGAKVLVDGCQSIAHQPVDVGELGADFFVFSGHKMYGPTGVGVLYGRRELLDAMPPYQCGGDMIDQVTFENTTFTGLPLKFEAGTPMIAQVIGLGAAIDYLHEVGLDHISAHEQELLAYATPKFLALEGLRIIGTARRKAPIISFVVDGAHSLDIGTLLDFHGVAVRTGHHCSQPAMRRFGVSATVRVSFGLYSTRDEVDRFISALEAVLAKLV